MIYFLLIFVQNVRADELQDLRIIPGVSLSETYDDNIFNAHAGTKSDFITNVIAGLSLAYKDELKRFEAKAGMTQQFFWDHHDQNNTGADLGLAYAQELSKYDRVSLSERFSTSYEPANFEDQFGRTLGRYRYYANEIIVEYIRDVAKQTQVKAFYSNVIDAFSVSEIKDSYTNTVGLEADHSLSEETALIGLVEFSRRDFQEGASASRARILAGLQQDLTKQLSMEARVGVDIFDSYRDDPLRKPYVRFSLTDAFDELTQASVSIERQYDLNPHAEDIFKEWRLVADFTRQPVKKFSYTASVFTGEGRYVVSGLRDTFFGAGFDCSLRLTEKMKLIAAYQYSTVDSNETGREYDKHKFMLGLEMEF